MKKQLMILCMAMVVLSACGRLKKELQSGDDADESASEISSAALGGMVNSTESSGGFQAYQAIQKPTVVSVITDFLTIKPAFAAAICPVMRAASCGEDGVIVLEYDNCHFGGGPGVWNGSQKLQFSSLATCLARTGIRGIPTSGNLLRTFGGNQNANPTTRTIRNRQVILDTETAAGYSNPVSGGAFVEFGLSSNNEAERLISIRGLNLIGSVAERPVFNVSVSTAAEKPLKVEGVAANKEVSEGTLVVQHNLAKFTATSSVVETLKFAADCCHPVEGSIQTVFSGSKQGSETVIFSNACGEATLRASDGSEASILLRHCF